MRFVLRKEIISLLLTIGLGLSGCATQEQIRAELESEEGRALIKEAVQEEMKSMMKSEEHKAKASMFVGNWVVDAVGNGELDVVKGTFVSLKDFRTVSIREGGAPSLRACGLVEVHKVNKPKK